MNRIPIIVIDAFPQRLRSPARATPKPSRRSEARLAHGPAPSGRALRHRDPSEKDNKAAENLDKVVALQKRVNTLAVAMVTPLILQTEFNAMKQRTSLPPALPDENVLTGGN